jgi:transposase-like protein
MMAWLMSVMTSISASTRASTLPVKAFNGIEAFWSFTKRRLTKFNGVKKNFELHLKECEWRYNKSTGQLVKELRTLISKNKNLMV